MKKFIISTIVAAGVAGTVTYVLSHRKQLKGTLKRSLVKCCQNHKEHKVEKDVQHNHKNNLDNVIKVK